MEEKELKVENIPGSYALCFNGECGKKDTCMHYQAMLLKRGERGCGMAIYPTAWQDGECCYYREKKLVRKAWGFSQLYKNVDKYHKAEARQSVSSFFGRGNGPYYRAHHGELLLTRAAGGDYEHHRPVRSNRRRQVRPLQNRLGLWLLKTKKACSIFPSKPFDFYV